MGYTIEKGKSVIWTKKVAVSEPYPFHDVTTNYTEFYKNLRARKPFATCLAALPDAEKVQFVSPLIGLKPEQIKLRSKHSHNCKKNTNP